MCLSLEEYPKGYSGGGMILDMVVIYERKKNNMSKPQGNNWILWLSIAMGAWSLYQVLTSKEEK